MTQCEAHPRPSSFTWLPRLYNPCLNPGPFLPPIYSHPQHRRTMPTCSQANSSLSNVQNAAAPPHPTAPSSFQLLNVTPLVSNPPQPSTADATTRRKHKRCGKVTATCKRQLPKFQCEQQGECAIHKLPRMNNTSSNSRPKKEKKKNSPRSRGNTN